jgi:hypothetical protein
MISELVPRGESRQRFRFCSLGKPASCGVVFDFGPPADGNAGKQLPVGKTDRKTIYPNNRPLKSQSGFI